METTLKIQAKYEDTTITDMIFRAYFVPENDENEKSWYDLTMKLESKILQNQEEFTVVEAKTDELGNAIFQDMRPGLYLIMADDVEQNTRVYKTSSFLVRLPIKMQREIKAKISENPLVADYQVIKRWEDDCHKEQRPESIKIHLFCDGEAYDLVSLPQNGHWNYTWKNLDTRHNWTVLEEQQEGYKTPEILQENTKFIITNICSRPGNTMHSVLPQTGQLWWPVPILFFVGLLFVIRGLKCRRHKDEV